MNSFYFVMNKLTGQNLSKSVNEKDYCLIMYKLIQKYIKRKVNKMKFLKLEEVLLERQEVNLQKSLKWTDRQTYKQTDRHTDRLTDNTNRIDRQT